MFMSQEKNKSINNEWSSTVNLSNISHKSIYFIKIILIFTNITKSIEQELQKIADNINKANKVIVFLNTEVSTNCDIFISINLYFNLSLNNRVTQNF